MVEREATDEVLKVKEGRREVMEGSKGGGGAKLLGNKEALIQLRQQLKTC